METFAAGVEALRQGGKTIPNELMDSFNKYKVALKGPITTPVGEGFATTA
jgi:isocitrate dehydrogenase (NAD+)